MTSPLLAFDELRAHDHTLAYGMIACHVYGSPSGLMITLKPFLMGRVKVEEGLTMGRNKNKYTLKPS